MTQTEVVDDMFHFYSTLSEKRTKVLIAKTKNEELTRRLGNAQTELFAAKDEYIKKHNLAEQAQQMLSASHVKAITLKENKRRKHDMVELLKQLSKEEYLPQQKRNFRESQSMAKSFSKETSAAPWLPEKKELLSGLDEDIIELQNIRNELKFVDDKIQERKNTIDLHQRYPFRSFCIDVIMYRRKSANIKRLLSREFQLNEEMKAKLPEKCNSIEESQDYLQSQLQTQTQTGDDLEKSVLEHGQEQENDDVISPMDVAVPAVATAKTVDQSRDVVLVDDIDNNSLDSSMHSQAGNTSEGAPGDFMSMMDMVNESANVSGAAEPEGGEFFELFGGKSREKLAAGSDADNNVKGSQERVIKKAAKLSQNSNNIEEPQDHRQPQLQTQTGDDLEKSVLEHSQEEENGDAVSPMDVFVAPVAKAKTAIQPRDTVVVDGIQNNFLNFSTHSQAGNTSQGAPGDFMSMLDMVNESENASGAAGPGGGEFFDLFGGGHDKSAAGGDADNGGKDSQESVGGMFNFNFGNSSVDDGPGASKKSFFDF